MKLFRVLFTDGEREEATIVAANNDIEAGIIFDDFFFDMGFQVIDISQAPVITAGGLVENITIQEG